MNKQQQPVRRAFNALASIPQPQAVNISTDAAFHWDEEDFLFDTHNDRYVGRVQEQNGKWLARFQAAPGKLPPRPHETVAEVSDKQSAQTALERHYSVWQLLSA